MSAHDSIEHVMVTNARSSSGVYREENATRMDTLDGLQNHGGDGSPGTVATQLETQTQVLREILAALNRPAADPTVVTPVDSGVQMSQEVCTSEAQRRQVIQDTIGQWNNTT